MRLKFVEFSTPDGQRSAYLALPDGAYDENWKSSCVTVLREADDEASVVALIEQAGLARIVDGEKSVLGFPNPIGGKWDAQGKAEMTPDERFVQAFSSSALPSGFYSEGWRVMGDVHYMIGVGSGARLAQILTALYPTNGLAAAICTVGGGLPDDVLARATGSPVPAYLLGCDEKTAAYYIAANDAKPLGGGKYVCDHNAMQRVRVCGKTALDCEAGAIAWDEFFHVIRRVNTSPYGDVDRRIIPEQCGFEWHTDDARLGDNGGMAHSWIEHCPDCVRAQDKKVPLVIFSHGMSDNPLKAADMIKIHEIGQREGFVSVYTFASNHYGWNLALDPAQADDMAYYEALIAYLCKKYPIDTSRIYLSGFSNGAGMAMTYAMHHPAQIAAIFPVDSAFPYAAMGRMRLGMAAPYLTPVPVPGEQRTAPPRPRGNDPEMMFKALDSALAKNTKGLKMPVMYFYGTRESEYPIGPGGNQELSYNFWKKFNGIEQAPSVEGLQPDSVGVPGQKIETIFPDPAHPSHSYGKHTFFADNDPSLDYYNLLLMHGKAHEVHPAERELGWAFVSRFRREPDGKIEDSAK